MQEKKPVHRLEFEMYYHLGESRNPARLARLQMPRLYPELPIDSKEWETKFNSLYMKYRRWESREEWQEIAEKRGVDKARLAEVMMKKEEDSLSETVRMYRRMVRFVLQKFAEEISTNSVKVKSLDEAKRMMELDMYLTRILDSRPKLLTSSILDLMTEEERRQADKVFEWLRKQTTKDAFIRDLQDTVNLEAQAEVLEILPSPKVPEESVLKKREKEKGVPDFLQPIAVHNPDE